MIKLLRVTLFSQKTTKVTKIERIKVIGERGGEGMKSRISYHKDRNSSGGREHVQNCGKVQESNAMKIKRQKE